MDGVRNCDDISPWIPIQFHAPGLWWKSWIVVPVGRDALLVMAQVCYVAEWVAHESLGAKLAPRRVEL